MREDIETAFGQVDVLVNCAGGDIGASGNKPEPNNILGITYEDLITLTNNNLIGTMLVTQAFVPQMVDAQVRHRRQHRLDARPTSASRTAASTPPSRPASSPTRAASPPKSARTASASTP